MRSPEPIAKSQSLVPIVMPVVPLTGLIPPDIDRILSDHVRSCDPANALLRNALYVVYAPRLHRILRRYWYRSLCRFGCDLVDLEQETFLIFARLLETWSGDGSFSAYAQSAFPWRLHDAARRLAPRDRPLTEQSMLTLSEDDTFAAQEAAQLLDTLTRNLSAFEQDLLRRHIHDGESLDAIARSRGLSARTMRRAWLRLRQHLAEQLTIP